MKEKWNHPEREPEPASFPVDPELEALAHLFREHAPAEPSARAWQLTFKRIRQRVDRSPGNRALRWRWPGVLGLMTTAAAVLGGVLLARSFWTSPATSHQSPPGLVQAEDNDDPFPVATLSEINIIRMNPHDADRLLMGQPLIGSFELASTEEIDIVQMDPDPGVGRMPHLQRNAGGLMVILALTDEAEQP